MAKKALGKGLAALISSLPSENTDTKKTDNIVSLPLHSIKPNPKQPRQNFDTETIQELAESIKRHGVIQPIVVKKLSDGYQIIAGERRYRAAKLAGLDEIPAVITEADELKSLEIALIENLQRKDLSPLEVAKAIKQLIEEFSLTQEEIAEHLGWSRPAVANKLRLLNLAPSVQQLIEEGKLTEGHARVLASLPQREQALFSRMIITKGWSVRKTEEEIKKHKEKKKQKTQDTSNKTAHLKVDIPNLNIRIKKTNNSYTITLWGLTEEKAKEVLEKLKNI